MNAFDKNMAIKRYFTHQRVGRTVIEDHKSKQLHKNILPSTSSV